MTQLTLSNRPPSSPSASEMSRVVSQYVTELYVRLHVDVTDSSEALCHARHTRECRELAAVLVNNTYDVVQQDSMLKVRQALNDAITVLGAACPTSGSLPVHILFHHFKQQIQTQSDDFNRLNMT